MQANAHRRVQTQANTRETPIKTFRGQAMVGENQGVQKTQTFVQTQDILGGFKKALRGVFCRST